MNKKFFVAALSLLTLISIGSLRANAQSSCPNQEAFGVHTSLIADKNIQSQIEVTYFTTNDPNAFISEQAGLDGKRELWQRPIEAERIGRDERTCEAAGPGLRQMNEVVGQHPAAEKRRKAERRHGEQDQQQLTH